MRCRMTCFAVCAAMRPKPSGVTSSRLICSSGTSDQSMSRSSSEMSVCWRSPVSSSSRSSSSSLRSRASSSSRVSMSAGSSIEKTRKSPFVVDLDGGVARRAGRLLVGGEERVLERRDERALFDALVALDLADGFDDLLAHRHIHSRRSGSPARSSSYGISVLVAVCAERQSARPARQRPRRLQLGARACAASHGGRRRARKCAGLRSGRSIPGEETSTEYSRR